MAITPTGPTQHSAPDNMTSLIATIADNSQFPVVTTGAVRQAFETGDYPYAEHLGRREYVVQKARIQAELLKVQL